MASKGGQVVKRYAAAAGRIALHALQRVYALALIVVIGWLTYSAVAYLVASLVAPAAAPPQITAFPVRLDEEVLRTQRSRWLAMTATEAPRLPLAHYHLLGPGAVVDPLNTCTQSGCHAPLPHAESKEVRAFLNMHATSIHCGVCHMKIDDRPLPLAWYELEKGDVVERPALLAAYDMLTSEAFAEQIARPDAAYQDRLVRLLRQAATAVDTVPALHALARHFAAVRPGSPAFSELIVSARESLPRHFRGQYGAKLALRDKAGGRPILGHPGNEAAVETFLRRQASLTEAERDALLDDVHPLRRTEALRCGDCHTPEGGLVDFARAGFPAARIENLVHSIVTQMIEHINEGRPFSIPEFTAGGETRQR